jgi:uncharacterized protein (DUF305 family)
MLKHHIGGVHMAEAVIKFSDDDQVRSLAQSMVDGQKKEMELINLLLTNLGAA